MPLIATRGAASAQGFGEFAQSAVPNYIEQVFSTYLYAGNSSTQTITNGIDLSTKGGMVWIKGRDIASNNAVHDTVRGVNNYLVTDTNGAQANPADNTLTAFNTNGFSLGSSNLVNRSTFNFASWTFRKQPKFFDTVTYTGNGVAGRQIPHSLGSVPGCIIIKSTNSTLNWYVYHRYDPTKYLQLNLTAAAANFAVVTATSDTTFTLPADSSTNADGYTYVAYLFAHDAGGFGLSGNENVVSCGSFTTDGSGYANVNIGYEPQWVLYKMSSASGGGWAMVDTMRGMTTYYGLDDQLFANTSAAEAQNYELAPTATGFTSTPPTGNALFASQTYIYIAIRRGPMKVPTLGTSVFKAISTPAGTTVTAGFAPDFVIAKQTDNGAGNSSATYVGSRLQGNGAYLSMSDTSAEGAFGWQWNDPTNKFTQTSSGAPTYSELFARAPGFMDVVCVEGGGTTNTPHNLAVIPELIIGKSRSFGQSWQINCNTPGLGWKQGAFTSAALYFPGDNTPYISATMFNKNVFTSNNSGQTYVVYLFATCPGVSKVGSYTGTGTTQAIACGFTAGARFVLIKRSDSTGDWYYWDSARGIVAGSDPYLLLNNTAVEVTGTDYIDTSAAGFEITSTAPAAINAVGGSYIFLAVA